MHRTSSRPVYLAIAALVAAVVQVSNARAQLAGQTPPELEGVGVEERLETQLPLDLEFEDENGDTVRLGQYFDGSRPVILTLNYYRCPMLCGLQLNGLVEGLTNLDWTLGREFEMVTVSIDPLETPELARAKKQNYLNWYERPGAADGWHLLTGRDSEIRRLADTVGFRYRYDEESKQYAHPAVVFVSTPDGRVARYLYGIEYPAKDVKLALLEASRGEIGDPLDQLILYCFHYDPSSRRYTPAAMNIMRVGGGATALILGLSLATFWIRDVRRKKGMGTPPT